MFFSAMDLGWKRVHLFIFLTFLKYAVGSEVWIHQNDQSQQDGLVHMHFSRGLQSSVLEAPATGSIPFEEVDPNVVPGKSSFMLTASSAKSSGLQTGGNSNLLSAPSSSSTGSLGRYRRLSTSTYGSSGPQMTGFRKFVSTSGLLAQSPSTGQNLPGLLYARLPVSPLDFSQSPSGQNSYSPYTSSSQSSIGTPLKASLQYVPGSGSSSSLSVLSQATSSQYAPALSLGGKLPVSRQYYQGTSLSPSWSFQKWQPSVSMTQGFQASSQVLKGSGTSQRDSWSPSKFPSLSSAGGSISSSVQSQGTSSQKVPVPLGAKVSVYSQAAPSGSSLSLNQPSQWQPSSSRYAKPGSSLLDFSSQSASGPSSYRQYIQSTQSRAGAQLPGSSPFVPVNTPTGGSSLQLQGTASLYAPAFLGAKVPVFSQSSQNMAGTQLAGSKPFLTKAGLYAIGSSLQLQGSSSQKAPAALDAKVPVYSQVVSAPSQTSPWKPSTSRWSQGFQASGTVASDSSSLSQGSKDPSRFPTITLAAKPTQFVSAQRGSGRFSGMPIKTQSLSNPYSAKLSASPLGVSQSNRGQGSYSQYTLSSQSVAGTQLAGSNPNPAQTGSASTGEPLKIHSCNHHDPTVTCHCSKASKSGSPLTGSAASLSSVPQSSKSVAGTQLAGSGSNPNPAQTGSTSTGEPLKIHSCNHHDPTVTCQCNKASKSGSPLTGSAASLSSVPQSSSSPQSSKSSVPSSQTSSVFGVGFRPAKLSAQAAGASASVQYPSDSMTSSPLGVSQSNSGQGSYSQYTLSSQSGDGTLSSLQLQGTSKLYAPLRQSAKVPVNSLASPSRPSQSQPPKWQASSSWSKGVPISDTVASQSGSPFQGSKALSRFSTLASAASTSQFASIQGLVGSSGLSRLSQDPSSPYSPASPAYVKRGSSGLYVSNSQSVAGTQLSGSNPNPAQTGSTSTGEPLKIHSCNHHDPTVTCQCNKASKSGSPLTGSAASQSSVPQSSSSPQSSKSSVPSSQTSSFFGVGLRPAKLSAQAAGASASVQYPSDSMTSLLGSSVQGGLRDRLFVIYGRKA